MYHTCARSNLHITLTTWKKTVCVCTTCFEHAADSRIKRFEDAARCKSPIQNRTEERPQDWEWMKEEVGVIHKDLHKGRRRFSHRDAHTHIVVVDNSLDHVATNAACVREWSSKDRLSSVPSGEREKERERNENDLPKSVSA